MILGTIGTQVGSDLNPKVSELLDTDELNQKDHIMIQTQDIETLNEEIQTDYVNIQEQLNEEIEDSNNREFLK